MHTLRLLEDQLAPGARTTLPPLNRVLYVRDGEITVANSGRAVPVGTDTTWHGATECVVTAGAPGATVLRFELHGESGVARAGQPPSRATAPLLAHPISLDPAQPYLMRCDRVEFAPGGEALPHGHRGGGIRYLLVGELEVRVGEQPGRLMKPGDAWFESGREPVHAIASTREPTAFIRVSILPLAIRGQSSIVYVDPMHAAVKPRKYTVYVDEPIDLR
jgi:quercetin dioxygenase-like cupin family protein